MIYMGSKNRLSKEIVPIIQKYIDNMDNCKGFLVPFCGGANIEDKIKCDKKISCDIDLYLIACLTKLRDGWQPPQEVTREEYIEIKNNKDLFPLELVGYIGYELSFGAKWFGGYVKRNDKKCHGDIYSYKSCMKQAPNLKGIDFVCCDFRDIPKDKIKGCVIYCDPPYRNTTKYKTGDFPYEEYYQWCRDMGRHNIVLCSEYWMPDDFECIWEKKTTTQIDSGRKANDRKNDRVEKLYIYNKNVK